MVGCCCCCCRCLGWCSRVCWLGDLVGCFRCFGWFGIVCCFFVGWIWLGRWWLGFILVCWYSWWFGLGLVCWLWWLRLVLVVSGYGYVGLGEILMLLYCVLLGFVWEFFD